MDTISWDATIPADSIQVKVQHGWITLTGELDWQYQKKAAHGVVGARSRFRGDASDSRLTRRHHERPTTASLRVGKKELPTLFQDVRRQPSERRA
jgi:hypothetical protein